MKPTARDLGRAREDVEKWFAGSMSLLDWDDEDSLNNVHACLAQVRADERERAAKIVQHMIHNGGHGAECSSRVGSPNKNDRDVKRGQCTFSGHWLPCEHCAERAVAILTGDQETER